ncbi:MAG: hypothetical protein O3B01_17090 [Planctomycetota bacterium]|nr:hypothetical protein [Planctomycetota bacterium]MDA1140291.1 hypothetical protein [Planctomycetota bacterium]
MNVLWIEGGQPVGGIAWNRHQGDLRFTDGESISGDLERRAVVDTGNLTWVMWSRSGTEATS